jgi:hypothetical protein
MRKIEIAVAFTFLFFVLAAPAKAQSRDDAALTSLVKQMANAQVTFDQAALDRILTSDYIEISPAGEFDPRAKVLGFYEKKPEGNAIPALEVSEFSIRNYGKFAIVIAKLTYMPSADTKSSPPRSIRATFVCRKEKARGRSRHLSTPEFDLRNHQKLSLCRRRPIAHLFIVVYGGAHLYSADTPQKLGKIALRSLQTYAGDVQEFAAAFGLDEDRKVLQSIYKKTVDKLQSEPVEDLRIDFEDGYGFRPNEEEGLRCASSLERTRKSDRKKICHVVLRVQNKIARTRDTRPCGPDLQYLLREFTFENKEQDPGKFCRNASEGFAP